MKTQRKRYSEGSSLKYTICKALYLLHENINKKDFSLRNKRDAWRWWEWILKDVIMVRILMLLYQKNYWNFIVNKPYINSDIYIFSQRTLIEMNFMVYEGKMKIDTF